MRRSMEERLSLRSLAHRIGKARTLAHNVFSILKDVILPANWQCGNQANCFLSQR
jgi:hypothetical protein